MVHEKHRDRMRQRFENLGIESFDPHQVLEMLLFYAIPRKDTNEIAHRLIDTFGTFARVLDAPIEELEKVEGMGHRSALFLKIVRGTHDYYKISAVSHMKEMQTIEDCATYLTARMAGKRNEEVWMLCLDGKRNMIHCEKLVEGDLCSAHISTRKVINVALSSNAVAVVLAHNHPAGFALPSDEDIVVTKHVADALRHMHVQLLDHIIVADSDYVSLYQSNLYEPESM